MFNIKIDNIIIPFNNNFDWSQNNLDKIAKSSINKIWLHHFQSLRFREQTVFNKFNSFIINSVVSRLCKLAKQVNNKTFYLP